MDDTVTLASARPADPLAAESPSLTAVVGRLAAGVLDLPAERLPLDRSLVALGLDSLSAAELSEAIAAGLGVEVPLADLLAGPSLAELAADVAARMAAGAAGAAVAPAARTGATPAAASPAPAASPAAPDHAGSYPLSQGQQALWLLDRMAGGGPAAILAGAARVCGGELDGGRLAHALTALVARHPALRSCFAGDGEAVRQVVHAVPRLDFTELDGRAWTAPDLARRLADEAYRPFDLAAGPLLRAALVHAPGGETLLLLAVHHIVADFGSLGVIVEELGLLLAGGEPRPLAWSHPDLVRREAELLAGPEGERLSAFWRAALPEAAGAALDLPTDRPRPPRRTYAGAVRTRRLPDGTATRLWAHGRGAGATPFMTLLAAFQVLLARHSGQPLVHVGTPAGRRAAPATAGLVGYYVNPVVLRGDLAGDPDWDAHLERVRDTAIAAFAHQDLPFPALAERLGGERDPSRSPLFQAMFVLYGGRRPGETGLGELAVGEGGRVDLGGGRQLAAVPLARRGAQFDLSLAAAETAGGGLAVSLQYNTDLFDAATAERLLGHLAALAATVSGGAEGADGAGGAGGAGGSGGAGDAGPQPISRLPMLAAAERHQLAVEWNDTGLPPAAREAAGGATLHGLCERQADLTPAGAAVAGQGLTLTYRELDRRANQLARYLRRLGAGAETPVALCVERSPGMVVALLAILKAGAAYVPLDPSHPAERIGQVLADSGAAVVVAESRWLDLVAAANAAAAPGTGSGAAGAQYVVCLDREREWIAAEDDSPLAGGGEDSPASLAYVIYTSGSTGRPKGVALSHGALVNFLRAMAARPGLAAHDVMPALTTLTFDIAGLEIWLPLTVGARVEMLGRDEAADAERLAGRLAAAGATVMQATPATWRLLLDSGWPGRPGLKALCGGEALPWALAGELLARGLELWNVYGPTETAVWSSAGAVGGGGGVSAGSAVAGAVGLGRPIADTSFHVVDPAGDPAPLGVAGELRIGGAGLARGYWGRPDLTAERFVPDPWPATGAGGARLYRTGDLVRHRPDGEVEFLGRLDHQVKIRGFRIELGEIEAALLRHPGVAQAAVIATGGAAHAAHAANAGTPANIANIAKTAADRRLVACVAPRRAADAAATTAMVGAPADAPVLSGRELRDHLRALLPEYMVPAAFVVLDRLPQGTAGKIDRRALAALAAAAAASPGAGGPAGGPGNSGGRGDAVRTPIEELLAGLWAEVLASGGAAPPGPLGSDDDFFQLGGHSLLGVRVAARLRDLLGIELPLLRLLQLSRLGDLAREVESLARAGLPTPVPIRRLPRTAAESAGATGAAGEPAAAVWEAPASFAQERLWFLDQLEPGSPAYSQPMSLRLDGPLDVAALTAGLAELRRRHEALRTRFVARDGGPVAQVAAAAAPGETALPIVDLTALPQARRAAAAAGLAAAEARRPFDLAAGPLLRHLLLRLAANPRPAQAAAKSGEHRLLLSLHHIVTDGWSMEVLARELAVHYRAATLGRPPLPGELPALPIQYPDYAAWQREWLSGDVLAAEVAFWRSQLAGDRGEPPAVALPCDRPRAAGAASPRGARRHFTVDAALAADLAAVARRHGATLFMTLLAALDTLLLRHSGETDLAIGAPVANRGRSETEHLIGIFVNTLVLRLDLAGDPSFAELLARTRQVALAAYAHQDLPFEALVAALAGHRQAAAANPFFDILFALHPTPPAVDLPGLQVSYEATDPGTAKFDLALTIAAGATGPLAGTFIYRTDLFDAATIERLGGQLCNLLAAAAADPGQRLSALPLLSPAESHQLRVEWNASPWNDATPDLVHALFERQALRRPRAIALVDAAAAAPGAERTLTYGGLRRWARAIARTLRAQGAGPEHIVGLAAEPSFAMVAGLLGILEAGGAYLPLDLAHPRERLAQILADSGVTLVLAGAGAADRLPDAAALPHAVRILPLGEAPAAGKGDADQVTDPTDPANDPADPAADPANSANDLADPANDLADPVTYLADPADDLADPGGGPAGGLAAPAVTPDHAAYVLYTSGSTGRPKGVVVSHRAVVNRLRHQVAADLTAAARVLQRARIAFDVSIIEIFAPLAAGAAVVLTEAARQQDATYLARTIADRRVTHFACPPALLPALLAEAPPAGGWRALRRVIVGGERVPADLPARFHAALADAGGGAGGGEAIPAGPDLLARYGPTEATVSITEWLCRDPRDQRRAVDVPAAAAAGQAIPLGRPITGARLYVLDRAQRLLPSGAPGELCVAGVCLARGYLARPDLTAAAFLPDPFAGGSGAGEAGGRLYRTGDLVRQRADGVLEFLGRIDRQVKIRGFRIELGEIEAALAAHPELREAAVVDRDDRTAGGKHLVAYLVPRQPAGDASQVAAGGGDSSRRADAAAALDPRGVRDFLAGRLPAYMVPAAFVVLPRLPLTANGKLDRTALPAPVAPALESTTASGADAAGDSDGAARDPLVEILAGIWGNLLGLERIGAHQDFFDLGGHSLLATQLASRVRAAFGIELPLRALFESSTLAAQAELVAAARREGRPPAPALRREPRDAAGSQGLPLSFAQQRLWFLDQLEPGGAAYNMPAALWLDGPLDAAALRHSLGGVIHRHEALRTSFAVADGTLRQTIHPPAGFALPVVDLAALPAALGAATAARLAANEARRPFDLGRPPLARGILLRLAPERHLVVVVLHHIAGDGASVTILVREAAALYRARAAGGPAAGAELPELPVQYADYAAWQRRWLAGETLDGLLAFWRRQLAGLPAALELPTDQPRTARAGHRAAFAPVHVSGGAWDAARRLAGRHAATPFMVVLAAFQALLARWSGQDDLAVGSPAGNRTQAELEPLIGFFVNTLVLRGDLAGRPTFAALLGRAREVALAAFAHQELPFEAVVEELQPRRDFGRSPLFQVMLVLQAAAFEALRLPGIAVRRAPLDTGAAKFELCLTLTPAAGGGLAGELEYDADLFHGATARRLAGHFEALFAAALADPAQPVAELALLSAGERHQLLVEPPAGAPPVVTAVAEEAEDAGREGAAAWPAGGTLAAIFARQAAAAPDAVAVSHGTERLTYGDLAARARRLAAHLAALGVGVETRVGLLLERSPATVAAILGVLTAGGAYVPLDPAYPEERLRFLLDDAGLRVLVSETAAAERVAAWAAAHDCALVVLGAGANPAGPAPATATEAAEAVVLAAPGAVAIPDGAAAYVIYTSGSTGRPKGVAVTHRNVVRLFSTTDGWFGCGPADVWTLFHSFAFDFSVWEIWGALLYGGRLAIVPQAVSRSPEAFRALLDAEGVTVLNQTPSAFYPLAQLLTAPPPGTAPALRLVIFGGEALEPAKLLPWLDRHGDERPRLINMYGITETTVHVTFHPVRAGEALGAESARHRIGAPIPDLRLHLLGPAMQPVPLGIAGEIHVGGAGLARGYLGRPDLTARRFVPDPWSAEPGARLYASGDLARRGIAGELDYLGRSDHQVKVRGFRIEPGEIEAALARHPAVRDAVVIARGATPDDRRLVAYLTPAGDLRPATEQLRGFLAGRLPEHMIPAAFVLLDALPVTAHGKLDRAALPEPAGRPELTVTYVAPRTRAERGLAEAWAEVLGLPAVGVHDNFFTLGGDSIRSIRARARAAERGLDFTLEQLFRHQTIAELAPHLTGAAADEAAAAVVVAGVGAGVAAAAHVEPWALVAPDLPNRLPADVEDAYPLSLLQLGMLYHGDYETGGRLYHNVSIVDLAGALDPAALARAAAGLAARHPVLRTAFDLAGDGEPLQLVLRPASAPRIALARIDLAALPPAARATEAEALYAAEQTRPFDWRRPPLLRFSLFTLAADRWRLCWSHHHAVLDGWSVATLFADLLACYRAEMTATPAPPPPRTRFADFIALERQALASDAAQRYWTDLLRGVEVAPLPRLARRRPEPMGVASSDHSAGPGERPAGPAERPTGTAERPPETGARARARHLDVRGPAADALRALAAAARVPFKSVLLAAHLRVLATVTGRPAALTGLVANGRPETADADLALGLFLNTVPLPVQVAGGTWADLARRAFAAERDALPWRHYPLAAIRRDLDVATLFTSAWNYANYHRRAEVLADSGLAISGHWTFSPTEFDLAVDVLQDPGTGDLILWLSPGPGGPGGLDTLALAGVYERTLAAMAAPGAAGTAHGAAVPLGEAESHQLLREWSREPEPAPRHDLCLHHRIAEQAERAPETIAVVDGASHLSYGELAARAGRLARDLRRSHGVGPEARVAVALPRSLELIETLFAVLAAGGAYVPLDPAYPETRKDLILAEAGVAALLTTAADSTGRLGDSAAAPGIRLDADVANVGAAVDWRNPAYVIYTSGSTGVPKGVVIPHGAAAAFCASAGARWRLGPGERVLQFSSSSFDASVEEIFGSLAHGATLVLRGEAVSASVAAFLDEVEAQAITVLPMPTAYWHEVASALVVHRLRLPATVRLLAIGGEAARRERLADWQRAVPPSVEVINEYGPTETTVTSLWRDIAAFDLAAEPRSAAPIGRPLPGVQVLLLGPDLEPVPLGVEGEMLLGGVSLARGYLGQPATTAERFLPNPWSDAPGGRLYRTGDLARCRADGSLEFSGRADRQVKVRGFRIELGEIEAALRAHPQIVEAVVAVRRDASSAAHLAAYIVPAEPPGPPPAELRQLAAARLPGHMVPSRWRLLASLPRNASGKIDHAALAQLDLQEAAADHSAAVLPRDETEMRLAAIWGEVLRLDMVSVTDDFFTLGGHSLLAVQLAARVEHDLGAKLPLADIVANPTVERLAERIRAAAADQARTAAAGTSAAGSFGTTATGSSGKSATGSSGTSAAGNSATGAPRSPLVPIRPRGDRPPLYLVHPIGGNVACYVDLARRLGDGQPVYGLQSVPPPQGADAPAPPTLEGMAAAYVEAVQRHRPRGPYRLGGWSMGGVIAYEMARQLTRAGEIVDLVAIIDAPSPTAAPARDEGDSGDAGDLLLAAANDLARLTGAALSEEQIARLREPGDGDPLARLAEVARAVGAVPPGIGDADLRALCDQYRTNLAALHHYRPQAAAASSPRPTGFYAGALDLFFAASHLPVARRPERASGWEALAAECRCSWLDGDHYSVLRGTAAEALAHALRARLAVPPGAAAPQAVVTAATEGIAVAAGSASSSPPATR